MMDHIVVLDSASHELEDLLNGTKSMILRGADEIKIPYGKITRDDTLYFVNSDNRYVVEAKAIVSSAYSSCRLSVEESFELIIRNQNKLVLPDPLFYRWAGKKFITLVEVRNIQSVKPFRLNRGTFSGSVDWKLTGKIEKSIDFVHSPNISV
jgi:hypothetical protein